MKGESSDKSPESFDCDSVECCVLREERETFTQIRIIVLQIVETMRRDRMNTNNDVKWKQNDLNKNREHDGEETNRNERNGRSNEMNNEKFVFDSDIGD